MPLTAWRIGHTAVTCDGCGLERSSAARPNGYAVLLAAGWSDHHPPKRTDLRLGTPAPLLLCPACSRDAATDRVE